MRIRIRNKVITEPIINILYQAKRELTNGKLKDIEDKHNGNIWISCPIHKDKNILVAHIIKLLLYIHI